MRYAVDAGHDDGEKGSQEDERGGGVVADAEQDDGNRDPGDGADGAKNLEDRIDDLVGGRIPAEGQAQGNTDHGRSAEADRHAAKGVDDVAP